VGRIDRLLGGVKRLYASPNIGEDRAWHRHRQHDIQSACFCVADDGACQPLGQSRLLPAHLQPTVDYVDYTRLARLPRPELFSIHLICRAVMLISVLMSIAVSPMVVSTLLSRLDADLSLGRCVFPSPRR